MKVGKKKDKQVIRPAKLSSGDCGNRQGRLSIKSDSFLVKEEADKNTIPDEILLDRSIPGIPFGIAPKERAGKYIGMPQGAEGNIMVVGGNGSGKSSGIGMPALEFFKGPICAVDVKGELSDRYLALLRQGKVQRPAIIFDPMSGDSPSYDPFLWLQKDREENLVRNIHAIALASVPDIPNDRDPFWVDSARCLCEASLLHYFNLGLSFNETLCRVLYLRSSELYKELEESKDPRVRMLLGEMSKIDGKVLISIDRELRNKLQQFVIDPYISHAFRGVREGAESFSWEDLDKYNIFLKIPDDGIEQWGGAITLMLTQLIRHLERRPDKYTAEGKNCVQTLLLFDEFARIGKMEVITGALATLRSKQVNICLMIQSVAQLDKLYGEYDRRIIFDNCQYQAILRANDAETQKYLAELIGTRICRLNSVNESLDSEVNTTGYSRSTTETRDWAVCTHELSTLEDVLLLTPYGFCRAEKIQPRRAAEGLLPSCRRSMPSGMLKIEERVENARKRVEKAGAEQPPARELENTGKLPAGESETTRELPAAIGELILQWFPELFASEGGNEEALRLLKNLLTALAAHQEWLEKAKKQAGWSEYREANV